MFIHVNNFMRLETDEYDASTDEGGDTDDEIERYRTFKCEEKQHYAY